MSRTEAERRHSRSAVQTFTRASSQRLCSVKYTSQSRMLSLYEFESDLVFEHEKGPSYQMNLIHVKRETGFEP